MGKRIYLVLVISVLAVGGAFAAAGCGSSSKPGYCTKTDALNASVTKLKGDVTGAKFSSLQADAQTVADNAGAVVTSAKADFPNETSALDSAVSDLKSSVKGLSATPSPKQLIEIAPQIGSVVTSAKAVIDATRSKC